MADAQGRVPVQGLIVNNAQTRTLRYRQQAAELREMAATAETSKLARDLLDLADKYEELAGSISGG